MAWRPQHAGGAARDHLTTLRFGLVFAAILLVLQFTQNSLHKHYAPALPTAVVDQTGGVLPSCAYGCRVESMGQRIMFRSGSGIMNRHFSRLRMETSSGDGLLDDWLDWLFPRYYPNPPQERIKRKQQPPDDQYDTEYKDESVKQPESLEKLHIYDFKFAQRLFSFREWLSLKWSAVVYQGNELIWVNGTCLFIIMRRASIQTANLLRENFDLTIMQFVIFSGLVDYKTYQGRLIAFYLVTGYSALNSGYKLKDVIYRDVSVGVSYICESCISIYNQLQFPSALIPAMYSARIVNTIGPTLPRNFKTS